jgi:ADYC domain
MKGCRICVIAFCASACLSEPIHTSTDQQADMELQGTQLQGIQLHGTQVQGMTLQGFPFAGATLNAAALTNVRVEQGQLVAEQGQVTRRGADLVNAHLFAYVQNLTVSPSVSMTVEYRITGVEAEDPRYDPTSTGSTFLYTLEQNVDGSGSWQPACSADADGRHAAIPLAAIWDSRGNRVESSSQFTFGCTTGVVAKCYRWGYRPWVTGYGDLTSLHQICTRVARADYCGNGVSHTRNGTLINVWGCCSRRGGAPAARCASATHAGCSVGS